MFFQNSIYNCICFTVCRNIFTIQIICTEHALVLGIGELSETILVLKSNVLVFLLTDVNYLHIILSGMGEVLQGWIIWG